MTNKEYNDLPKGDPKDINIRVGSRFRTKESVDKELSPGSVVSFYEVISLNSNGFEFMEKWEKITE